MEIRKLITSISQKHNETGITINPPASESQIEHFEKQVGFALLADFREFYSICNGFSCEEDLFNITPIEEILGNGDYGKNWFYFAEYMTYSDKWGLHFNLNRQCEIFYGSYPGPPITSSLQEFLEYFLAGNVFDTGGLYQWRDKVQGRQDAANTGLVK